MEDSREILRARIYHYALKSAQESKIWLNLAGDFSDWLNRQRLGETNLAADNLINDILKIKK